MPSVTAPAVTGARSTLYHVPCTAQFSIDSVLVAMQLRDIMVSPISGAYRTSLRTIGLAVGNLDAPVSHPYGVQYALAVLCCGRWWTCVGRGTCGKRLWSRRVRSRPPRWCVYHQLRLPPLTKLFLRPPILHCLYFLHLDGLP